MAIAFDGGLVLGRARHDPEFLIGARGWTGSVRLEVGSDNWMANVADGRLMSFEQGHAGEADICITGPEKVWSELLSPRPRPGFTDIFAASAHGMRVEGDTVTAIGPYYPAVKRLIELLRQIAGGMKAHGLEKDPFRDSDNSRCRYIQVEVDGIAYRIFIQEAGEGIPLLLQHGEGADSRQWRHLLADPDLQKRFRMLAYDLPFHGKSMPPGGVRWWKRRYATDHEALTKQVVAISRALELDRPVFMGSSLGGQLAIRLAAHHADAFRAFVAINGFGSGAPAGAPESLSSRYFRHPRINEAYFAAILEGSMSPHAPERGRREAEWIAATSGLGIFEGDVDLLVAGCDLREEAGLIDGRRTPMWIVAGEYGTSLLDGTGSAEELAGLVPGASLRILPALGPFMMTEDPLRFRGEIIPILDEVMARISAPRSMNACSHAPATTRTRQNP